MADLAKRREHSRWSPQAIWDAIDELRETVKFNASSRDRIGRATIEIGRDFLVRGILKVTGAVSMVDADGAELLRIGDMFYGRGLEMKRANGVRAFLLAKAFENSTQQTWGFYDQSGQQVVAENSVGRGLYKPFLEYPFQPVTAASGTGAPEYGPYGWERETSSGSWTTLFAYDGKCQNGFLDFKFAAMNSDGATEGEVQVVDLDTGLPLSGFFLPAWLGEIEAGWTTMTELDPESAWIITPVFDFGVPFASQMRLGIQVRRTTGSGSITLSVPQAIGG